MATYYHGGSEIQANSDGIHTLYLMNPNYVPYSEPPQNMLFLNPTSTHALPPSTHPHAPPPNNHFVGIPLPTTTATDAPRPSSYHHHDISAIHSMPAQRLHYNLWAPQMDQSHHGISGVSATQQGGLSLSLSSQQQSLYGRSTLSAEQEIQGGPAISPTSGDEIRASGNSSVSVVSTSGITTGVQSVILGSKYSRAAQALLDEVVHVGKLNKNDSTTTEKRNMKKESTPPIGLPSKNSAAAADLTTAQRQDLQMKKAKLIGMLDEVEQKYRQYHGQMQGVVSNFEQAGGLGSAKSYASLALQTISKQFRCLKDAICAQIKAAGKNLGEDEEWFNNNNAGGKIEGSRLRYVDHHLRQQRALQQLGMIQNNNNNNNNTWRPQRGLPERAVSVLRAWLFEHFLHPYPKDSDKIILAKQTGLTRSQVSNWFINARVRLWKPMVEEMYLEEIKDQEQNSDSHDMIIINNKNQRKKQHGTGRGDDDNNNNNNNNNNASLEANYYFKLNHPLDDDDQPPQSNNNNDNNNNLNCDHISNSSSISSSFNLVRPSSDMILMSPKKQRTATNSNNNLESPSTKSMLLRSDIIDDTTKHLHHPTTTEMNHHHHHHGGGGFGSYPMGEIGSRFNSELLTPRYHGNGVSLTLGLPHSENISVSGSQQNYLSHRNLHLGRRLDIANGGPDFSDINPALSPHSASNAYDRVEIQTTKRFAAQLLPDFVA